jgi:UDP-N-acetylmuramyl pentapeptide phosphotransferase/UDP-N-acetylglucosamine-1-phosphate transferase
MKPTRSLGRAAVTVVALLVALFSAAAMLPEAQNHYAVFAIRSDDGVSARYVFDRPRQLAACRASLAEMTTVVRDICPQCAMPVEGCAAKLDERAAAALGDAPLPVPSARIPGGIVLFEGEPGLSGQACQLSAANAVVREGKPTVLCFQPGSPRPLGENPAHGLGYAEILPAAGASLAALFATLLCCGLLIRYEHVHARYSHDHIDSGPQKMHAVPTPRIGGLAVILGLVTGAAGTALLDKPSIELEFGWFLLAALPAFAGGIAEDLTKQVGVVLRLLLTMLSGAIGAWLLGATLTRMDAPGIDQLLAWAPFAVVASLVAVGGLANAINIIDGYNGLAGGYSVIAALGLAWIAATVGDTLLLTASLTLAASLLGFLAWNYPRGKIFLGDGGAYLVGFWLAEIGVLLTVRNPEVSAWFVMAIFAYPVTETLFSIYRRKLLRHQSPGTPDRMHFHQVFYHRAIRCENGRRDIASLTARNARVAPRLWAANVPVVVAACFAWQSHAASFGLCLAFLLAYVWVYHRLVHLRTPRWLIHRCTLTRKPAGR